MGNSDDDSAGALLEHVFRQLAAVLESVAGIRQKVDNLPTREDFNELSTDISKLLDDHERRVTLLVPRSAAGLTVRG